MRLLLSSAIDIDFALVWLIVQLLNLVVWLCFARVGTLRLLLDRNITYRWQNVKSKTDAMPFHYLYDKCDSILKNIQEVDQMDIGGFAPPRALRTLISFALVAQNVLPLAVVSEAQTLLTRSGQLACINSVCLVGLACTDMVEKLSRQSAPQTAWAHHLYGWIVWYQALIHTLAFALLKSHTGKHQ